MTEVSTEIVLDVQAPLILHIYSEVALIQREVNGYPTIYSVNLEAVAELLGKTSVSTGILPPNTLGQGRKNGDSWILRYVPAGMRTFNLGETGKAIENVPHPPLIWFGCGTKYKLWALNTLDYPTANTILFNAPFPNVYESGGICWGSTGTPLPVTHAAMDTMLNRFFDSGFNLHISNQRSRRYAGNVIDMWSELRKKQAKGYPLDDLIACSMKLSEVVEKHQ